MNNKFKTILILRGKTTKTEIEEFKKEISTIVSINKFNDYGIINLKHSLENERKIRILIFEYEKNIEKCKMLEKYYNNNNNIIKTLTIV